jgi:hypothetical protein
MVVTPWLVAVVVCVATVPAVVPCAAAVLPCFAAAAATAWLVTTSASDCCTDVASHCCRSYMDCSTCGTSVRAAAAAAADTCCIQGT